MFVAIFFAVLLISSFELMKCDCDLNKFKTSRIVPDIVPDVSEELKVLYPDKPVTCGEDIDIGITQSAPMINYTADSVDFYALIMIDPDAPDPHRPVFAHFLHWFIVNIPGNNIHKGKVLSEYMKPGPPPYSAPHRYIFLVFRQKSYVMSPSYMLGRGRSRFNVKHMWEEMKLSNVVAGNFFYTHS